MSPMPKLTSPAALLPSHRKCSTATRMGWAGSTAISGLLVSAIGAWALVSQEAGSSMGEQPVEIMMMLPEVPALEAMREPTPDVVDQQASQQVASPDTEETPDAPELTEAPDVPQEVPQVEDLAMDDAPEVDTQTEVPPSPIALSPRPKSRPEVKPEEPKQIAKAEPKQEQPRKKKKSSEAAAETKASRSVASASSAGAGSAQAAASYDAQVIRKVTRTRKRTAGEKGIVRVSFKISGSGALAGVSVVSSSGSAKLDQIAVTHIQRSAPFPPPPPGARTNFAYNFDSR